MNNIVRAFVLALTVTGSVAYTQVNSAPATTAISAKANGMPVPCCAPGDPDACGMHKW